MDLVQFLRRQIPIAKHLPPQEISLQDVRVASPCSASWERMAGDDRVRFCSECQLNVYNLSAMTRHEAESLVANREGRLCVRFYRRADGTMLSRNCPKGLREVMHRVSRIAGAMLSAVMSIGTVAAQTSQRPSQNSAKNAPQTSEIRIRVLDATGATIQGAHVTLVDGKGLKKTSTVTDSQGRANFPELQADVYSVSASAQYFQTSQQMVRLGKEPLSLTLTLPLPATMGVVIEVKSNPIETEPTVSPSISPDPVQPVPKVKKRR
jgi:carboxypeptidase family protein